MECCHGAEMSAGTFTSHELERHAVVFLLHKSFEYGGQEGMGGAYSIIDKVFGDLVTFDEMSVP